MAFRTIFIESEVNFRVQLNNLVITKEGEEVWIPLDDISVIVVDNLMTTITVRTLSQLAEKGVELLVCNREHLPVGYYGGYDNHSRSAKIIGFQMNQEPSRVAELWKQIVYHKIRNQSVVLHILNKREEVSHRIEELSEEVTPGDQTNRESFAAKLYFNELMGTSFSRGNENILLNAGLDYGYAVVRSYTARLCVGYGLNTQIGIHHRNEYNRFNLVDDLMEPFRPIVDMYAYRLLLQEKYLTKNHRHRLVNILNHELIYGRKKMILCNVMETYVQQMTAFISGKDIDIEYPNVAGYTPREEE